MSSGFALRSRTAKMSRNRMHFSSAKAQREEKLVLVLHVSGHFETPEFT